MENEYKEKYLEKYILDLQFNSGGSISFTDFEEKVERETEWRRCVSSVTDLINGAFGSVNIKQAYLTMIKEYLPECYDACEKNFEQRKMNYRCV